MKLFPALCQRIAGVLIIILGSTISLLSQNTGLHIEYGPNLGISHIDPSGTKHFYVHSTAVITNDSTIPIHLQFALAQEFEFPAFCNDDTYKVFLVPQELTPDTATVYNNILNGQHEFLNQPLRDNHFFHQTLEPGQFCVITIGVLIETPSNCAAVPRAIFSNDTMNLYAKCDRETNDNFPTSPTDPITREKQRMEIGVKLEYYCQRKFVPPEDGCVVIPIGQIAYR